MPEPSSYDPGIKGAVIAALLAGSSAASVAREYNIPRTTVNRWCAQAGLARRINTISAERQREIDDMLYQFIQTGLRTVTTQVDLFGRLEWLGMQPAQGVAILCGVLVDKILRVQQAMQDRRQSAPAEEDEA